MGTSGIEATGTAEGRSAKDIAVTYFRIGEGTVRVIFVCFRPALGQFPPAKLQVHLLSQSQ